MAKLDIYKLGVKLRRHASINAEGMFYIFLNQNWGLTMKKNSLKMAALAACSVTIIGSLTGCVGSNAVTAKLMKFNLEAVDNRYGRGGLNMLMSPIYGITVAADYIIFNSIGFWTGTNPLNGKPHIFDTKVDTMLKINDDLDPSLQKAPLSKVDTAEKVIYSVRASEIDENTLSFNIVYTNGDESVLRGEKEGESVKFYLNGELVSVSEMAELQAFSVPQA